ncbi:MAG: transcription antitermination factor NusB [Planctomycetota bacterium]
MRRRTRSRELALQFLYLHDLRGDEVLPERDGFLEGESPEETVVAYAKVLIEGVLEHRGEIDERIRANAHNWDISRIATVDRNILRVACYEILFGAAVPAKVAINEAIELGKKFSTANSGSFINGILDKILELEGKDQDGNAS